MVNILNKLIFLFFTFLVLSMLNSRVSFSKILDIKTPAKQAIIYDHEVDQVLFEKNADQLMKPASMAKVMTSYIVFDRIKDIGKVRSKKIKTYPPYLKLGWFKNHSKNNIKIIK